MQPLVTIGIPVFNTEKYICHTLDSIKNQTYKNIEIIVVDDGSTDNSYQQVLDWSEKNGIKLNLIRNRKNYGLTYSCNVILENANGEFLQKVDADDALVHDKIERHIKILQDLGTRTSGVYSNVHLIDEAGSIIAEDYFDRIDFDIEKEGRSYTDLLKRNFIPNPTVLLRTSVIKEVGGYDNSLFFEDWDLWLRIMSAGYNIFYDQSKTAFYRVHGNSMMMNPRKAIDVNGSNRKMFKKFYSNVHLPYKQVILENIKKATIYSYVLQDPNAKKYLRDYLNLKWDFKVALYYLFSLLRVKHHFSR